MKTTSLVVLLAVGCTAPPAPEQSGLREHSEWEAADFSRVRDISLSEARLRLARQVLAPALQEHAATEMGEDFAGVWIDPSDDDRVKVGVTRDQARPAALRAARRAGLDEGVDHVMVRYSMAQLAEARDWLAAELPKVNHGADQNLMVGLRTDKNAVGLSLPSDGRLTTRQRALIDAAQARYGDRVVLGSFSGRFTPQACVYPDCDPPLRGGVRIGIPLLGGTCTGAFIAKSNVDSKLYQFTAGHCTVDANLNFNPNTWFGFHSNGLREDIGPTHHGIWGPSGDMAIIEILTPPGWGWPARNWVLVTNGPGHGGAAGTTFNEAYAITATGWSVLGQRICITGSAQGASNCGVVTELDVSYTTSFAGRTISVDHAGRANLCSVKGDSGAPLYAAHTAFGLLSGAFGNCDAGYQGIRQAEASLNVKVLTQ